MPRKLRISPETLPAISQKWRAAGTSPQSFFNHDGTVNAEFFFTPDVLARIPATPAKPARNLYLDFACGSTILPTNNIK